jgi:capsular exopolysaccharide synthesis family protein
MELKLIWDIVWRRKWIILQSFFFIAMTIIIGSFLLPEIYESNSKLLLETSTSESSILSNIGILEKKAGASPTGSSSDYELENIIEIASSEPLLNKVISNLQISDKGGELLTPEKILKVGLLKNIKPHPTVEIEAVEDTDMFEIETRSQDPEEAAMIANTLARECIIHNLEQKKSEYKKIKEFIKEQIKATKVKYITALEKGREFSKAKNTLDIDIEIQKAIDRISDLMAERENETIQVAAIQARIDTLQNQLNQQNEKTVLRISDSENDYITKLRSDIIEYEMMLAETLVDKKKDHPDVAMIEEKLDRARAELNSEVTLSKEYSTELLNQKRELEASRANLEILDKEIARHMKNISRMSDKVFQNSQLKLEMKVNQDLYESMLEYLYEISIVELSVSPDIKVVEAATAADIDEPDSPNKVLNGILGIILGLLCGFSLGFMFDYVDDTIKNQEDVKKFGYALLGVVPKFKRRSPVLISEKSSKDPVSEAYRSIRNSIRFASVDKEVKSLVVTSPMAGEGKSTTASNLAISMANEGRKVLLVDLDFRLPSLHKLWKLDNQIGCSNLLVGQAGLSDSIQKTRVENLHVMTCGPIPPDPVALIESEKMNMVLDELIRKFDRVVIDVPPVLAANDAIVIARRCDGLICIIESCKQTHAVFKQTKDIFDRANIQPLGLVLNKLPIGRAQRYYYYY